MHSPSPSPSPSHPHHAIHHPACHPRTLIVFTTVSLSHSHLSPTLDLVLPPPPPSCHLMHLTILLHSPVPLTKLCHLTHPHLSPTFMPSHPPSPIPPRCTCTCPLLCLTYPQAHTHPLQVVLIVPSYHLGHPHCTHMCPSLSHCFRPTILTPSHPPTGPHRGVAPSHPPCPSIQVI
jgi:hypothetical protein